jgi:hypothetical protein
VDQMKEPEVLVLIQEELEVSSRLVDLEA